jgi:asparagine synthase (glutamine-hydrolysing)
VRVGREVTPVLDPLDVASGVVVGVDPAMPVGPSATDAREALRGAVQAAVRRPPCFVSFSGGRDSSAVLAVAADVARREGLPLPIPVTNVFPAVPTADESQWQERVVAHLSLDTWIRIEHRDELGVLGPVATEAHRAHGLLWPFNAYFHAPLLARAAGGTLLTGLGGDEMLAGSPSLQMLALLRRPGRTAAREIASTLAPTPLRAADVRRQLAGRLPWLRAGAHAAVTERFVEQAVSEPLRWRAHVLWRARLRYLEAGAASLGVLAAAAGASIAHPFLDVGFVGALAAAGRSGRYADRTGALRLLVGDLLPAEVVERSTKVGFDDVFWDERARAFAADWAGEGVDEDLVDPERLRREWLSRQPDPRSYLLAQLASLSRRGPGEAPPSARANADLEAS